MIEYTVQVDKYGTKSWYHHGQLHREDGPAVELSNGYKEWYHHDQLHREDGPAVESANGYKVWYLNGQRHRADGPAAQWADGTKMWFLNGVKVIEEEVMKPVKQLTVAQIEVLLGHKIKVIAG